MASTQPTPASLPLFPTNHRHRLSELDLDPRYGYFFGIGYLLAIAHRDGIANRNLQASKLSPPPGTGLFYLLSWQKEEVKLSPQSMAGDFLKPFATFDAPGFQAVLAGYVQSAYIQLEPLYPGYVREFLAVIGGTPERVPAPAPPLLDLAAQLQNLNRKLVLKDGHLSLEITGTAPPKVDAEFQPPAILSTLIALTLSGIDVAATIDLNTSPALSKVGESLGKILNVVRDKHKAERVQSSQVLGVFLGLTTEKVIAPVISDQVADCLDSLARFCDEATAETSEHTRLSINFAQTSVMIRGAGVTTPADAEVRCLTIMARHARLAWFPKMLSPLSDPSLTLTELAYANTRSGVFVKGYEGSSQSSQNHLWSLLFKSLALSRQSIVEIQQMPVITEQHETTAGVFALSFSQRLTSALLKLLAPQPIQIIGGGELQHQSKDLAVEFAWVSKLMPALVNAGGQSNPRACFRAAKAAPYPNPGAFTSGLFRYWR